MKKMKASLLLLVILHIQHVYSTSKSDLEKQSSITLDTSALIRKPGKVTSALQNNIKRVRPEGYNTKKAKIERLALSIRLKKPHLGAEGAEIAANDEYLQKSRKQAQRYRDKLKELGVAKDTRKRKYKPKPKDYYSTENRTIRKAFTILRSKDNNITKFDQARKEAEEMIRQRQHTERIRAREKYRNQKTLKKQGDDMIGYHQH
ncbi:uncharacterized protein FA14DRAFT_183858 [Meira miltonrushii]|uniref:Uncharacterized protein n=1 Tax=Meira miltonrushii TaxID=1280837 RepID=A0A316VLS4_9BASI|nr:uncharacterized protein FA14DRAFT_183858 [Meira miltonrushii]PWN38506.1 hypothetical protein FA14DRAFT_183858 [Meira miltonrushii]